MATTVKGQCHICQTQGELWFLAIFWRGSEGLSVCHDCRMDITEAVRNMSRVSNRTRKAVFKRKGGGDESSEARSREA